jgi:hypothetical protein
MKKIFILFSNLCIGILFYFLFLSSLFQQGASLKAQQEEVHQSRGLYKQYVANIPLLQKEVGLLEDKQIKDNGVVGEQKDETQILQELAKEVAQSGIQEARVSPEEQGFAITGRGSAQQLLVFFRELLNHGRRESIYRIELSDAQNNDIYKIEMHGHERG